MFKIWAVFYGCISLCFGLEDTLPRGQIQFKVWYGIADGDRYFDEQETPASFFLENDRAEYDFRALDLEVTYGLHRDISLVVQSSQHDREVSAAARAIANDGLEGVYLGIRQRLNPRGGGIHLLTETGVFLPEDSDAAAEALPLSSGGVDWVFIMSYNQDFFPTRGGFEMDFGYRFRNEFPDDEWFFHTNLKLAAPRVMLLKLFYDVVESKNRDLVAYDPLSYPKQQGSQRLGVEISRRIFGSWQAAVRYGQVLEGRNSYETTGWRLGVFWRG